MRAIITVIFAITAFFEVFGESIPRSSSKLKKSLSKSNSKISAPDLEAAAALMNWIRQMPIFAFEQCVSDLEEMEYRVRNHPLATVLKEIRLTMKAYQKKTGSLATEKLPPAYVNMIRSLISTETRPLENITKETKKRIEIEGQNYTKPVHNLLITVEKFNDEVETVQEGLCKKLDETGDWVDSKACQFD